MKKSGKPASQQQCESSGGCVGQNQAMNSLVFHVYGLRALRLAPSTIAQLFRQIPESEQDRALGPDRFTPREVLAHLADFEPVWRERVEAGVVSSGSPVESRDEDQMAIEGRYSETNPWEQLELFAKRREEMVRFLEHLPDDRLQHTVVHSQLGEMKVMEIAYLVQGHDAYHIQQLTAYL